MEEFLIQNNDNYGKPLQNNIDKSDQFPRKKSHLLTINCIHR